jgi:crossover junction endodeoxyribonuclease RuvC
MIILGIDPGIGRCGWGVVEVQNSKLKMQNFGCIQTFPEQKAQDRLKEIYKEVTKIIKTYKPDVLSIEQLFFAGNAKTAFAVGEARGVILLVAAQNKLNISTYTPLQVKMVLTGYGRAEKKQIGQMVKTLLKLKEAPKSDDAADGLAIALTYIFSNKLAKLKK